MIMSIVVAIERREFQGAAILTITITYGLNITYIHATEFLRIPIFIIFSTRQPFIYIVSMYININKISQNKIKEKKKKKKNY